jgi:hypothetical protein
MSRLDSFIRRLLAQRACIDHAAVLLAKVPGPVLELGLGNGRTYDHLRERFPGRAIFVFDHELAAHPSSRPDEAHFIQGDFRETLKTALPRIGAKAALAHCDIGSHSVEASRALGAAIAPLLAPLMAKGGLVLGDQPMAQPGWTALPLPDGLEAGRYHMYRAD